MPDQTNQSVSSRVPGILPSSQPGPSLKLKLPSIEEILESPLQPVQWILPRMLAAGDICILGGPSYSGKSWIIADLALSWASGRSALSWAPPFIPQRVLWIDEEQSKSEAWHRVRQIAAGRGIGKSDLQDTLLYPETRQGLNFRNRTSFSSVFNLVDDFDPHWVIFDSLVAISRATNENSSTELRQFYQECLQPINSNGRRGIILIHHNRKSNPLAQTAYDYSDSDNLRGAGDIKASADAVLMAWRIGATTFLHSDKARSDPLHGSDPPWDLQLCMQEGGGTGDLTGMYPKVSCLVPPSGNVGNTLVDMVRKVLTDAQTSLSTEDLVAEIKDQHHFEPAKSSLHRALSTLFDAHEITKRKEGRTSFWTVSERG